VSATATPIDNRRIPGESGTWVFLFGDMLVFGAFFVTFLVERATAPEVFDAARVLSNQEYGQVFDSSDHAFRFPFEGSFAPTVETRLVGFHFDKDPIAHARIDNGGRNFCYFHPA